MMLILPIQFGLLQNLPSILCCHVLNPQPGQRALDMCAAPGNKTTHLATLMENTGEIIALDKSQKKIDRIISLCECLGISCVKAYVCDSTKCTRDDIEEEKRSTYPFFTPSSFDSVLLDAPCSGLGQRPQLLNNITVKQLKSYPPLQKKLFRSATSLVKTGGNLVYSTCTMTMAENEDIVQWALKEFPELKLLPAEPILGNPGSSQNGLNEEACQLVQRFGPPFGETPETDTIGFFIAKFVKV
uniref:SAM-dependent MTase RsmB/NOP-type domain-containing protein n=1 Tax=Clastoptera arizonana TaxID=38151 RepID=A0A1B6CGZ5_9HEMI